MSSPEWSNVSVGLDGTRSWHGARVTVAEVARMLRELRESETEVHSTLTSVMNLVAWAPDAEAAAAVEALTDALSDHHPSRAVIVCPAGGTDGIDARVEVMPRADRPGGRVLRVEQIVLTLHGAVAAHAGSAVIPLLRSELPTFLWWPGAPDPAAPAFTSLAAVADRIVTEAARDLDGAAAVARLVQIVATGHAPVTDLAWAAISPWRQMIASALRPDVLAELRDADAHAVIACSAGEPPLAARLLAGWLTGAVASRVSLAFHPGGEPDPVQGIRLTVGERRLVEITRDGMRGTVTLHTTAGGPRCLPFPAIHRGTLVAGELELRGRDHGFEAALAGAAALGG